MHKDTLRKEKVDALALAAFIEHGQPSTRVDSSLAPPQILFVILMC